MNRIRLHLFVCLLILETVAGATPVPLADLVDTNDVLQCYHIGVTHVRCRNVRTGEDWRVCERAENTKEKWVGSINHDGTKLVLEDGMRVAVVNLDGSNKQFITSDLGTNGYFWSDSLGNDWVVYTGESESYLQAGTTWKVRIDSSTNGPIEATRTILYGTQYSCGLSGNGRYLGDAYPGSYVFDTETGRVSPPLDDTINTVGSIHPGDKPWLMYDVEKSHHLVAISEWNQENDNVRRIWQYTYPQGEIFGVWASNNEEFATFVKDGGKLFLVKLTVDVTGDSDNIGSYQEAFTGLSNFDNTLFFVGRPWVGTLGSKADRPTISPSSAEFAQDSFLVTMSSRTDGANVYYTTDGTTPTQSATPYTGPFYLALPATGESTLSARATGAGLTPSSVTSEKYSRLPLHAPIADTAGLANGLDYTYYEGYYLYLEDIERTPPKRHGVIDNFDITAADRDDEFAFIYDGYIQIPGSGKYTFYTWSDDSSHLYIDSQLVVANNHRWDERSGYIGLTPGYHEIRVEYQQGDGGKELKLAYEGPQIGKCTIPDSVLFRRPVTLRLLSPHGAKAFRAGQDTMVIQWDADTSIVTIATVELSLDSGATWKSISPAGGIGQGDVSWGEYVYEVPALIDSLPPYTTKGMVRVSSAAAPSISSVSKAPISIIEPTFVACRDTRSFSSFRIRNLGRYLVVEIPYRGLHEMVFARLDGREIWRRYVKGNADCRIRMETLAPGTYVLRVTAADRLLTRKVHIAR